VCAAHLSSVAATAHRKPDAKVSDGSAVSTVSFDIVLVRTEKKKRAYSKNSQQRLYGENCIIHIVVSLIVCEYCMNNFEQVVI
jgi:hypothetical protein